MSNIYNHYADLSKKLRKLCKPRNTKHGKLDPDLCVETGNEIIYLTNVFKDGFLLGFWSHSPWGHLHDQETGWILFDQDLVAIEICETRTMGLPAGNDWRSWRKEITRIHGKSYRLAPEWGGEQFWKITDC